MPRNARSLTVGKCGDSLRRRFPFALAGEVSGSGGARTTRRRIQLGAAAAACSLLCGAPRRVDR
eukprot:1947324-Prymnesium_polylepis.1